MSVHDDMMADMAVPAHLDQMGDTVSYAPINGIPRDIVAVLAKKSGLIKNESSHATVQTMLFVTTSHDEDGIETASMGDTIYIACDRETWGFQSVKEVSGGFITVQFLKVDIEQYGKRPSNL